MDVDVAVVGGGIAGMSVAAELARHPGTRVAVLEQEAQLAYHSSGRSAATFLETYGSPAIRALTRASRPLFEAFDADGEAAPLLTPRPLLWVASTDAAAAEVDDLVGAEPLVRKLDVAQAHQTCPALRKSWLRAAAIEEGAQDLDVAGLFDRYRQAVLRHGASVLKRAAVRAGKPHRDGWLLSSDAGEVQASIVVNAAGAWADELAMSCGIPPRGLTPLRRTVAVVSCEPSPQGWPLVSDITELFYFRPEGSALLISPADEIASPPGDAKPEMEDVALALERVNGATTLNLRHVNASWAGLRTFAPDRNPVVGFDPDHPRFFWLAGQGGYGMQTAPAMALLAASLIRGATLPDELGAEGVEPGALAPARLTPAAH
jgi:D-arginine dehydrogenase